MSQPVHDLEDVCNRWRHDADALRRNGDTARADWLMQAVADVERTAQEWLAWISVEEAALRSGYSVKWVKGQFAGWEARGHARRLGARRREIRAAVVPMRRAVVQASAEGRDMGRRLRSVA